MSDMNRIETLMKLALLTDDEEERRWALRQVVVRGGMSPLDALRMMVYASAAADEEDDYLDNQLRELLDEG